MIDGDKYRFNLQFTASTDDAKRAGEALEALGKRKSQIVIAAVCEYLDAHPGCIKYQSEDSPGNVYKAKLEKMVRAIIDEKIAERQIHPMKQPAADMDSLADSVDSDVMAMLGNIELFQYN